MTASPNSCPPFTYGRNDRDEGWAFGSPTSTEPMSLLSLLARGQEFSRSFANQGSHHLHSTAGAPSEVAVRQGGTTSIPLKDLLEDLSEVISADLLAGHFPEARDHEVSATEDASSPGNSGSSGPRSVPPRDTSQRGNGEKTQPRRQ